MKSISSKSRKLPIYLQAVIAMLFINFIHKIVREIPGALGLIGEQSRTGGIATIIFATILFLTITLLFFRIKWALILGIIPAVWIMLQWVLVHVIWSYPDQNGIWWYPIFPVVQGALIIYFSIIAWRKETEFST
ncbi:hypothetical protein KAX75_07775 [candidate division WOR-3 bacterium]|nr:hypothetical protein [candidate division WOR-3 bacterium]